MCINSLNSINQFKEPGNLLEFEKSAKTPGKLLEFDIIAINPGKKIGHFMTLAIILPVVYGHGHLVYIEKLVGAQP